MTTSISLIEGEQLNCKLMARSVGALYNLPKSSRGLQKIANTSSANTTFTVLTFV